MLGSYRVAAQLAASQEGLSSKSEYETIWDRGAHSCGCEEYYEGESVNRSQMEVKQL
jgi:hypothetical protein